MPPPLPFEDAALTFMVNDLREIVSVFKPSLREEAKLQVLEYVSSQIGGFDFDKYRCLWGVMSDVKNIDFKKVGVRFINAINRQHIPHAFVLASLAKEEINQNIRKRNGVYYTDSRLARYLMKSISMENSKMRVLDPSSGTGTLLASAALAMIRKKPLLRSRIVGDLLYGADLSKEALRGCRLVLASLTNDFKAIKALNDNLRQGDSLEQGKNMWSDVIGEGFEVVIGNPPWERIKLTFHENMLAHGQITHYGAENDNSKESMDIAQHTIVERKGIHEYIKRLGNYYIHQGRGEADLYKYFIELAVKLVKREGIICMIVPGGVIRSLGTMEIRRLLMSSSSTLDITLFDNKARFFGIDTRFKFVVLRAKLAVAKNAMIRLLIPRVTDSDVLSCKAMELRRTDLEHLRSDLSIPEIRNYREMNLFRDLVVNGNRFGDPHGPWAPHIMREVDMTRDKPLFSKNKSNGKIPVIEGRMVHQFEVGVKSYVSGSGRRAIWETKTRSDMHEIMPQYWVSFSKLPNQVQERVMTSRVGFCDITGQTNERTMLASRIPSGVVCGNKVPTIVFRSNSNDHVYLSDSWLAIANSLTFDWLLRRVVTTTVNYFLLLDLPMPKMNPLETGPSSLSDIVTRITQREMTDPWIMAKARAELDCDVLIKYGQGLRAMQMILNDFPLLDRAQMPLDGENRSTITRDYILKELATKLREGKASQVSYWNDRVERARVLGAIPYVPTYLSA